MWLRCFSATSSFLGVINMQKDHPLSNDETAKRKSLYDNIQIPMRTLDRVIIVLTICLVLAIVFGIVSGH